MVPRLPYYRVYTSSNGLPTVADAIYDAVSARAQQSFIHNMPRALFRYIASLSWFRRLIYVNKAEGYPISDDTTALETAMQDVRLPGVLCRYIESLGPIKLANGASVIPYCANYRELIPIGSQWFYDPLEALEELGVPDPHTPFSFVSGLVAQYTEASSQFYRCGIELRTVKADVAGFQELIIGFSPVQDLVTPLSPELQIKAVGDLGAAYQWRDHSEQLAWPFGDNQILSPLFVSESVSPTLVIANLTVGSMH